MTSSIISVRIPKKMKKELEQLNIDISEVVREALETRLRVEKAKKAQEKLKRVRTKTTLIPEDLAGQFVREERERHD